MGAPYRECEWTLFPRSPIGVGFVGFFDESETGLCPFLAAQQQSPGVTHICDRLLAGGFAANPIGVGCGGFAGLLPLNLPIRFNGDF